MLEPLIRMAGKTTYQPNTVGLNQTTLSSSDEHVDPYCEICVADRKRRITPVGLCKECNTFVCQLCLDSHSKWPGMRNHTILQGDEMPRTQAEKPVRFPGCEIHKNCVNDNFCLNHHKMMCGQCIKSLHGTCDVTSINELCTTLDKRDVRNFVKSIENTNAIANMIQCTIQQKKDNFEQQREAIIKEAEDLKQQLNTTVQSITVDKIHINKIINLEISNLDERSEDARSVIESLESEICILEDFDEDTVSPHMFLVMQGISERVNSAHQQLNEVGNQLRDVFISFVPNPAVTQFLSSPNSLGELRKDINNPGNFEMLPEMCFPPNQPTNAATSQCLKANKQMHLLFLLAYLVAYSLVFMHLYLPEGVTKTSAVLNETYSDKLNMTDTNVSDILEETDSESSDIIKVTDYVINVAEKHPCDISKIALTQASSVDVQQSDETYQTFSFIPGMAVSDSGTFLITDYYNKKLKAFSSDGTFLSSLSFSDEPRAIALINSTTAVVSTSDNKLQFLNASLPSELSLQTSVSLGYTVIDLTVYNNKLIVIVWSKGGMVKMLDLEGNEIWSTSSDSSGQPLFKVPLHLITKVINNTGTVIVTDYVKDKIVFLDVVDGKLLNTIDVIRKGPAGLAVDKSENVYICYSETSEISVWSPNFNKNKILLKKTQLQGRFRNFVYSDVTGELFISYQLGRPFIVDRFHVTCG